MFVRQFDAKNEHFEFEDSDVRTVEHRHPLHEVVRAISGSFNYSLNGVSYTSATEVFFSAGELHSLDARGANVVIEMWGVTYDNSPRSQPEPRVAKVLGFLGASERLGGFNRISLGLHLHLSPGRAAEVFRDQVGVPIGVYLRYRKLLFTMSQHLGGEKISDAGLQAGFYDAAHFSRSFRKVFGVAATSVYNRQTVQVG